MKAKKDHIEEIIFRKIHNRVEQKDLDFIEKWNADNTDDRVDLESFSELNTLSNDLSVYQVFSAELAWSKVQRLNTKFRISRRKIFVWSSAAIFILLTIASVGFLSKTEQSDFTILGKDNPYLILADETEVYLSDASILQFEQDFLSNRIVHLQGDAFFHVANKENTPFIIETDNFKCTVLGTSFRIEQQAEKILIRMREGKLQIESISNPENNWMVEGNESVLIGANDVEKIKLNNSDLLQAISFKNAEILEILETLNTQYAKLINFNADNIQAECTLTAKFESLTLLEILQELNLFFSLDYKIQNGKLVISHLSC